MYTRRLREVDEAYTKLAADMRALVATRKAELASNTADSDTSGSDLFTRLVSAAEAEGKNGLDEEELVSASSRRQILLPVTIM